MNRRVSREQKAMAAAVSMILAGGAHGAQNEHPNVIVIIADDMGYSDISPFGGEIPTPNLQAMAEQSIRMSQYYTSPMSAPARSMLLTGNSNQQAGMGGMWWYDSTIGKEGYELRLTDRVTTMAERFKDAGYNTLMAGKWHLGFCSRRHAERSWLLTTPSPLWAAAPAILTMRYRSEPSRRSTLTIPAMASASPCRMIFLLQRSLRPPDE